MRAAVAKSSPLGLRAKQAMDQGRLVDDAIVLGMIRERLAEPDVRNGFILDGFPRNLAQAHALDSLLSELGQPLDAVVQMDVQYGELTRRISGRRSCPDCGRVFNLFSTPAARIESEKCPQTGAPHKLFQRPDDTEETVARRLKVYEEQTRPLIAFYGAKGLLQSIDAEGDVDLITQRLESALRALSKAGPPAAGRSAPRAATDRRARQKTARPGTSTKKKAAGRSVAEKPVAGKPVAKATRSRTVVATSGRKAKRAPLRRAAAKRTMPTAKKVARKAAKRAGGRTGRRRPRS